MRLIGLLLRYWQQSPYLGNQSRDRVVLSPKDHVPARWIKMSEHVGLSNADDGVRGTDDVIDVVMTGRVGVPTVKAFVVVLQMVTKIGVGQRTGVGYSETGPQWLTLTGESAALSPTCLRDIRYCRQEVLHSSPEDLLLSLIQTILHLPSCLSSSVALMNDLPLMHSQQKRVHPARMD